MARSAKIGQIGSRAGPVQRQGLAGLTVGSDRSPLNAPSGYATVPCLLISFLWRKYLSGRVLARFELNRSRNPPWDPIDHDRSCLFNVER